jgi:hypothetical protein
MHRTMIGVAAIAVTGFSPLYAQVREGERRSLDEAKIVFGYVCDDRFVVTNESTEPVRLEYSLERSDSRTALNLDGRESVELLLSSSEQLNLMMEGRVIASARNERRECEEDRPRVVVRRPVVSIEPTIVVVRSPYHRYYDWGWWHHRHHHPRVSHTVVRIPIIIGRSRDRDRGRDNDRDRNRGRRGR